MLSKKTLLSLVALLHICISNSVLAQPVVNEPESGYAFFAGGHVYGSPLLEPAGLGVHPPLLDYFPALASDPAMQFGFFLGDSVKVGVLERWEAVDDHVAQLGLPVHMVLGNHDATDTGLFIERYGPTYRDFEYQGDRFIILDAYQNGWSIKGEQLQFLQRVLKQVEEKRNIFIFTHPLIWWETNNDLRYVRFNSASGRASGPTNFWTELAPLLTAMENNIYWLAGDMGAFPDSQSYMFYKYKNMTFIGSGMGGGKKDNLVVVRVAKSGEVSLQLVALNGDNPDALGNLEDARLPNVLDEMLRKLKRRIQKVFG